MTRVWTLMVVFFSAVWTDAVPFSTWLHNETGVKQAVQGDKEGAYKSFNRGLEADPLNPRLQLNLGITFEMNQEYDKAANTYEAVSGMIEQESFEKKYLNEDERLQAVSQFNLGNARAQAKQIPEAVRAYQAAFDNGFTPEMVKTNIELLFQNGGGGDGKGPSNPDQKDQKESKDDDKKKDDRTNQQKREDSLKKPEPDKDKDKGKPKPFQSQELSPEDVKRILDEIKNQEQSIRAQENDKKPKDAARGGKDW